MFFEKQSLRTRLTFEAGMASMGGNAFFMDQTAGRLDAREKLSDIAHNVERWVDAIVLRTYSHSTVEGMAEHACIPVINALSDLEHPCQALADYFTLLERFGDLKKIMPGLCWRWEQRRSLAAADCRHAGLPDSHRNACGLRARHANRCRRAGYCASRPARSSKSSTTRIRLWTGSTPSILTPGPAWVTSTKSRNANQIFPPYQVNEKLVAGAAPHAVFMHCLPAHRGMEITDDVMDSRSLGGFRSG